MKNKIYTKSIFRELKSSRARFISILIIILLGTAFYSGIKAAGPNMKSSMESFYISQNLMDSKIVSNLGLSDNDLKLLEESDRVLSYYGSHTIDANLANENSVVRFMEYDSENPSNINNLILVEGRLPEKSGEIVIDEGALRNNKNLNIGSTYTIESDKETMKSFNKTSFEIVGIVKSPLYIERLTKPTTTVGKGTIDYFAVINKKDIAMDTYTEIYVKFNNVENLGAYSDEYKEKMKENNEYLKSLYFERTTLRVEELKNETKDKLKDGYEEIKNGEEKLLEGRAEIENHKLTLNNGKAAYDKAVIDFNRNMNKAESEIEKGEAQIASGQQQISKEKEKLELWNKELETSKINIDKAKNELISQGINPDEDLTEPQSSIDNMNSLINSYNGLSKDIKTTIDGLNENKTIPMEKIEIWSKTISNLGEKNLEGLIINLKDNPQDINTALALSNEIDDLVVNLKGQVESLNILVTSVREYKRGEDLYNGQLKDYRIAKEKLDEEENKVSDGKYELIISREKLQGAKEQGLRELEKSREDLIKAEGDISSALLEIEESEGQLLEAKDEMKKAEEEISSLKEGKYYFFDRNDNPGYSEFNDVVKRLSAIATVFPMFFFIVAVLICLTTMTRMVEENRLEIGTLKALGYNNIEIAKKYVIYASFASIIGSLLGVIIGFNLFPKVIYEAYSNQYVMPSLKVIYYPSYILQSTILSVICTVGASFIVLKVDLKSNPSALMQPKAPKMGKKILLERIKPVWRRLNFNQKVTFRNLFRYKQRMIMTIFGIAACTGMVITGFGLKDSISELTEKQFNNIWKYQAIVTFDEDSSREEDEKFYNVLYGIKEFENSLGVHIETVSFIKEGMNKQNVSMVIPMDDSELNEFVLLNDRKTEEVYKLSDEGVIINEKLAKLLDVSKGDIITFTDEDNNSYEVKVSAIVENYLNHSLYMSPSYYKQVIGEEPKFNSQLLKLNIAEGEEDTVASILMDCDKVVNVTLTSNLAASSENIMGTLNIVVIILIVSAGGLAFVVLYNLNNINVSERIRELSTIKVLGFYDREVTMYIFRENFILTVLGIVMGTFLGKILHSFVLNTAESDSMMMSPNIFISSYIYAILLTILFSTLVMVMMHRKLKKVNMIDALKSNE